MTEIIPDIHWFMLPNITDIAGLGYSNSYLVRGNDGYVMFDAGWKTDESFVALNEGMAEIKANLKDISQIVVTHIHPDHYGMAGRIKEISQARLAMHQLEKDFIDSRYVSMDTLLYQMDSYLAASGVPAKRVPVLARVSVDLTQFVTPIYPEIVLKGGETVTAGEFTFKVIWTPGHSSGHICLYEPNKKIFISGDHILPEITPNISVHPQSIANPLGSYLASLRELRQLDVNIVLPGHGRPFTTFKERIDEIIQHHEYRNREIAAAVEKGALTAYQIAQRVTWGIKGTWASLPDFHKRAAIFETLAHLEMMAANGQIERLTGADVIRFRRGARPL